MYVCGDVYYVQMYTAYNKYHGLDCFIILYSIRSISLPKKMNSTLSFSRYRKNRTKIQYFFFFFFSFCFPNKILFSFNYYHFGDNNNNNNNDIPLHSGCWLFVVGWYLAGLVGSFVRSFVRSFLLFVCLFD